jgi:uncharacterized membrane protein
MHALLIVLRVVHVVSGVFWAGTAFFVNIILAPSLGAAGQAGGTVMTELKRRRFHEALFVSSTLAVGSGLLLLWLVSAGLSHTWLHAPIGLALSVGALAGLAGFIFGGVLVRPLAIRLEQLQAEMRQASTDALRQSYHPRLTEVRQRLTTYGRLASGCLGVAVLAMAVARYL